MKPARVERSGIALIASRRDWPKTAVASVRKRKDFMFSMSGEGNRKDWDTYMGEMGKEENVSEISKSSRNQSSALALF